MPRLPPSSCADVHLASTCRACTSCNSLSCGSTAASAQLTGNCPDGATCSPVLPGAAPTLSPSTLLTSAPRPPVLESLPELARGSVSSCCRSASASTCRVENLNSGVGLVPARLLYRHNLPYRYSTAAARAQCEGLTSPPLTLHPPGRWQPGSLRRPAPPAGAPGPGCAPPSGLATPLHGCGPARCDGGNQSKSRGTKMSFNRAGVSRHDFSHPAPCLPLRWWASMVVQ